MVGVAVGGVTTQPRNAEQSCMAGEGLCARTATDLSVGRKHYKEREQTLLATVVVAGGSRWNDDSSSAQQDGSNSGGHRSQLEEDQEKRERKEGEAGILKRG